VVLCTVQTHWLTTYWLTVCVQLCFSATVYAFRHGAHMLQLLREPLKLVFSPGIFPIRNSPWVGSRKHRGKQGHSEDQNVNNPACQHSPRLLMRLPARRSVSVVARGPLFLLRVIWRIDLLRFFREPSTSRWLRIRRSDRSGPPTVARSRRLERRSDPMGVHFENKHGQAGFV